MPTLSLILYHTNHERHHALRKKNAFFNQFSVSFKPNYSFLILLVLSWGFWLKDYQKERILTFLKPDIDPQGISWNVNQSKIAIGSGGFFGKGINKGSQTQYGHLIAVAKR